MTMPKTVASYLQQLQDQICSALESIDTSSSFDRQEVDSERGISKPRIFADGSVIEKAAVNFTHSIGQKLPSAATDRKPEMAGCGFQAVSLSLIVHPRNPFAPTTHANLRFFVAEQSGKVKTWWFGGGFDLTPYYGFEKDAIHWHTTAKKACDPFGPDRYRTCKEECDQYFYLPHRKEARGIGGLFFDDWNTGDFHESFAFVQSVGNHFSPAYMPILELRKDTPYNDRHRNHQLIRRGRYVEFNLLYDRGTKYGLQSGRRIESVLASLPPNVRWQYDYSTEKGSDEDKLMSFLKPRNWVR
jgi:coproporphyrinogen III oxidase